MRINPETGFLGFKVNRQDSLGLVEGVGGKVGVSFVGLYRISGSSIHEILDIVTNGN